MTNLQTKSEHLTPLKNINRTIRENGPSYEEQEYALLVVDRIRKIVKFVNLRSSIFNFYVFQNGKFKKICDYFDWPSQDVKCRISIFDFDFSFYLKIQEMPQKQRTCSLEPKIFKLLRQNSELNRSTFSLKSGAEDDQFQLEPTQHQIRHKLNKSMNLRIQNVRKQESHPKFRDPISMISMERLTNTQRILGCDSEENGPPQRREHTVRTDVRTESEWFGFIPSKEIAFEIGSEDPLRQNRQLRKVLKGEFKTETQKNLLGKRNNEKLHLNDEEFQRQSNEKRFLNKNLKLRIQEMRVSQRELEHGNKREKEGESRFAESAKASQCVICLEETRPLRGVLDCDHSFCYECIRKWLTRKSTCPVCKINPRLIRKFKLKRFLKSEFTKQWKDRSFTVPIQIQSHWVVHEMESENEGVDFNCLKCGQIGDISCMVQCIRCHLRACHMDCLWNNFRELPDYQWLCDHCVGSRPNRTSYGRKPFHQVPFLFED